MPSPKKSTKKESKKPIPKSSKAKHKIEKVMKEFKSGTLKSSSGDEVTDPRQAKAIAFSEARRAHAGNTTANRAAARRKAGRS